MLAWLPLLAALSADAACVRPRPDGSFDEPSTYEALRHCQQRERERLVDSMLGATIGAKQAAGLKAFDARQRAEERDYVRRHPGSDRLKPAEDELRELGVEPGTTAQKPGATKAVDEPPPAAPQDELARLKAALETGSPGGTRGVTPEMAQGINEYLMRQQGFVSPDMQALLQATAQDGTNLRTSTMKKLQDAARQAKGAGLELGIDPATEKQLLEENLDGNPEYPGQGAPNF